MIGETNINGGGGLNGKGALLKIKALTGSVITVSKNDYSKILVTSNIDSEDSEWSWWFFETNNFGEWIITATLGTQTASTTVLISTNAEYDIELSYGFYLYNNGDLRTAVTGGWSYAAFLSTSNYSAGTLETARNGTTCYLSANGTNKQISAVTVNKIDVTNYRSLRIEVSDYIFAGVGYHELDLASSRGSVSSPAAQVQINSTGTFSVDVSSITGSYYIGLYLNSGSAGSCAIGFTKMYLVK